MLTVVKLYLVKGGHGHFLFFVVPGYIMTLGTALDYIERHYTLRGCEVEGAGLVKTDVAVAMLNGWREITARDISR